MLMKPAVLVYSSHDRSEYLHKEWIVQRALESHDNKTIFYIPFSMSDYNDQHYSWSTFKWYFDRFTRYGLKASTFYWTNEMSKKDIEVFMDYLLNSEVVIFGGGSSMTGLNRCLWLGEHFYDNVDHVKDMLFQRHNKGKLTAGFSAGADQLCEILSHDFSDKAFGLAHKINVTLHHEWGKEGHLQYLANRYSDCLVFGLPNDSGIAVNQGKLKQGEIWQLIQFITDNSWDIPHDQHHIKTRQGMKIDHFYCNGKDWRFNGGDMMLRILYPDNRQEAWIMRPNAPNSYDYWTQLPTDNQKLQKYMSLIFD